MSRPLFATGPTNLIFPTEAVPAMAITRDRVLFPMILALLSLSASGSSLARESFTLQQVRDYDFRSDLMAASDAERVVWLSAHRGRRNAWAAEAPEFVPRRLTDYPEDDGQDMSGLHISRDGRTVVYVRGGEHGSNWSRSTRIRCLSPGVVDSVRGGRTAPARRRRRSGAVSGRRPRGVPERRRDPHPADGRAPIHGTIAPHRQDRFVALSGPAHPWRR